MVSNPFQDVDILDSLNADQQSWTLTQEHAMAFGQHKGEVCLGHTISHERSKTCSSQDPAPTNQTRKRVEKAPTNCKDFDELIKQREYIPTANGGFTVVYTRSQPSHWHVKSSRDSECVVTCNLSCVHEGKGGGEGRMERRMERRKGGEDEEEGRMERWGGWRGGEEGRVERMERRRGWRGWRGGEDGEVEKKAERREG